MEFRILGPFEVSGPAGPIDLRGAKRRGLLACLVVRAGQPMSTDRLVEELWGDDGSDGAARTVQTYVSQLRKLLRGEAASLVTRPGGYVLEVDLGDVDASRFEQAVTAAGAEPDPARRLAVVDEALKLWRGPPLEEFAGADWADREATRLEALHLAALQRRYDALLRLGRAEEAVVELEQRVRGHPLDERLWAQFMLALYHCGRQADALGAYQQARRHLVDELGIEPGPELAELEHRILNHDPTLAATTDRARRAGVQRASTRRADGWYPRTFLLTDIVDSVSLWEHDPPAMSWAVARHDALLHDAVAAAGGELVRTKGEGDSTFSVFVHPSDALGAAAAIQEVMAAEPWPPTISVRVRTAVHTGDAEARDHDWYGPAVNRAARLRDLAKAGQTLISGVTAGLVADQTPKGMALVYRGRRALRGIDRPEEVWELVAADESRPTASSLVGVDALPMALTRFVGRAADLEQLVGLIETDRLVTLTGPGGSGKTRLAVELARHATSRGEDVWLVELAPLRDGGLVAQAVATAVGIEPGPDPLHDLLARPELLAGLMVLDNCEHLLDACATLVTSLLAAAPDLRVLATSREPLGLAGEREWPVAPLEIPHAVRDHEVLARVESVELLLDRARAVRPGLDMRDEDVASVVDICRALDGIPLAIELAAGRLRSLSFADLAARLGDQITLLARHRSVGIHDRHRTLRMALDWSYQLLAEDQRMLARRLSVFAGGFRLDAVEPVCGGADIDVLDGVDELVAKSLVSFDGVTARYRLLEPLRQYFAQRLEEAGETEVVQQAHAHWVVNLCERLGIGLLGDQKARSVRLSEESANIELALHWSLDHHDAMAIRIVGSLGLYWCFYNQASGRRWCDIVIQAGAEVAGLDQARALLSAGMIAQNDGAWDRSVPWLREALAIYRAEGAADGEATTLFSLGRTLQALADALHDEDTAKEATRCFEESLRIFTSLGHTLGAGWCRILLSSEALRNNHLDRSEELANQVVQDCSEAGARHPIGQALRNLASIARRRGDNDKALEFLHEAVALYRNLDDPWQLAGLLVDLGATEATIGRGAEALQALAESTRLDEQIGRLPGRSYLLAVAAFVHLASGQRALAIAALGAYEAHPPGGTLWAPGSVGYGWLAETVEATRAQLDPVEVAAAAITARHTNLDKLIDELIIQPAEAVA